jgi:hypothetical protein
VDIVEEPSAYFKILRPFYQQCPLAEFSVGEVCSGQMFGSVSMRVAVVFESWCTARTCTDIIVDCYCLAWVRGTTVYE